MAPIIFQRLSFAKNIRNAYDKFPDAKYFGMFEFMRPIYVIRDLDLINVIAVKNFDNFCDHRNFVSEELEPMAGRNLFGLGGDH